MRVVSTKVERDAAPNGIVTDYPCLTWCADSAAPLARVFTCYTSRVKPTLRFRSLFATLVVVSGCSGSAADYSDSVDLAEMRAAFHCDSPTSSKEREACKGLDAFAAAARVSFPTEGDQVYVGQSYCTSDTMIVFERIQLTSKAPHNPRVDAAHRPSGGVIRMLSSVRRSATSEANAKRTMVALRTGAPLSLPHAEPPRLLPANYDEWRDAQKWSGTPIDTLAQSDGGSLLESAGSTPAWWDDAKPISPFQFIRGSENTLVRVSTPTHKGSAGEFACVAVVYAIP